jgi:hypothetical protein
LVIFSFTCVIFKGTSIFTCSNTKKLITTITGCTFDSNLGITGTVFSTESITNVNNRFTVQQSTFNDNSATEEGGVFNFKSTYLGYTSTSNTFNSNAAGTDGGVVYTNQFSGFISDTSSIYNGIVVIYFDNR